METDSMSEDIKRGRRVRKHFEGYGTFAGEVVSYNHTRKFFRVTYEDGDKEEVDLSELQEILCDASAGSNAAQKGRTRKRKAGRKAAVGKVSTDGGKKGRLQLEQQGSKLVAVEDRFTVSPSS